MRRGPRGRHAVSIAEVEPTRELTKVRGGLFGNLWRAWASLKNGVVTRHVRRLVRFCLVGASGVVVNTALLYLLTEVGGMNHLVAAVFATEAAIINNFLLNDRWTFADVESANSWLRRALRYNSVALVGLAISVAVLAGLTYTLGLHYLVANLFAIGVGTLWNYTGSSLFTWSTFKIPSIGAFSRPLGWGRRLVTVMVAEVSRLWA